MIFTPTGLAGVCIIDPERLEDERGYFARLWCREEFERRGLNPRLVQCSLSHNVKRGTLRGMHFQIPPFAEAKLVRCIRGAIFDVALDLRRESPSFGAWEGQVLSASNQRALHIPEGCAHGFITLEDDTDVMYQMSAPFSLDHARGVRYDDPAFGIRWPEPVRVIKERDARYPDFIRGTVE